MDAIEAALARMKVSQPRECSRVLENFGCDAIEKLVYLKEKDFKDSGLRLVDIRIILSLKQSSTPPRALALALAPVPARHIVSSDKGKTFPSIFISLRLLESLTEARALKLALEAMAYSVFLCAIEPGDSIYEEVANNLNGCKLVVIMGTKTYGQQTSSVCSTYEELAFLRDQRKPYFLIKMCDKFEVPTTQFSLPFSSIAYEEWTPGAPLPTELAGKVATKLERHMALVAPVVPILKAGEHHIFFSQYKSSGADEAMNRILSYLTQAGIPLWYDTNDPGMDFNILSQGVAA